MLTDLVDCLVLCVGCLLSQHNRALTWVTYFGMGTFYAGKNTKKLHHYLAYMSIYIQVSDLVGYQVKKSNMCYENDIMASNIYMNL